MTWLRDRGASQPIPHHSVHTNFFFTLKLAVVPFLLLLHGTIRRDSTPLGFLQGPFRGPPVSVTPQGWFCSLPLRSTSQRSQSISPGPYGFSSLAALITNIRKLSYGATCKELHQASASSTRTQNKYFLGWHLGQD